MRTTNLKIQGRENIFFSSMTDLSDKICSNDILLKENFSAKTNKETNVNKLKPVIFHKSSEHCFCCPVCNKSFTTRSALVRHHRSHTGTLLYSCSLCLKNFSCKASVDTHELRIHNLHADSALPCHCGKLFIRKNALEVHQKIHSSVKPFVCEHCGKCFTQKVSRDIHIAKHTGIYNYQCSTCQKSFASQAKLNRHSFVHKTPRFTCELCGRSFVRQDTLAIHHCSHSEDHPFQCTICLRKFDSQSRLFNKNRVHNDDYPFQCSHCNAQFKQNAKLVTHLHRQHSAKKSLSSAESSPRNTNSSENTGIFSSSISETHTLPLVNAQPEQTGNKSTSELLQKKSFLCPHCGKAFCKKLSLEVHVEMHNTLLRDKCATHTCHICPRRFSQKSKLTAHIRTHLQEPPYQCKICDKRFYRKDVYNNHMFLHTNKRPFSCAHCGKAFASKFNLGVHLKTHSISSRTQSLIEFLCNDCGKKFKHKKTYTLHRKTHSGDFPHTCVTCGKKFLKKSHFEGHLRSHGSERPFQCHTCGHRFKEHKHCHEHARKAHPNTFTLTSLFASITNKDAQIDHLSEILCPAQASTHVTEDSSDLHVPVLPNHLQPTLAEGPIASSTDPGLPVHLQPTQANEPITSSTVSLDAGYLLNSQMNLDESTVPIPTIHRLVLTTLEPMLPEIQISSTTQYLMTTPPEKDTSCQMSLTILSKESTTSIISQNLET